MWARETSTKLKVSRFWSVCADGSSMALAELLTSSALAANLNPDEPPEMNPIDGFPTVGSPKDLSDSACSLGAATQVFMLLDWSSLETDDEKEVYESAFPELIGWRDRLENDPQSYVITYDAVNKHILLVGGSPQGTQHAAVSWLRDADHGYVDYTYRPDIPYLDWTPKHVLDYPELSMRVSLFPEMWADMQSVIYPWANSVVWNRYTHVSNNTQLFSYIAQEVNLTTRPRLSQFSDQAAFYMDRHVRMIPRLYSGQVVMNTQYALPDPPGTPIPAGGSLPGSAGPEFFGPDPTGVLLPDSNEKQRGIHLSEGLRVPLDAGVALQPPEQLTPIPKEQLILARGKRCDFYPNPPQNLMTQVGNLPDCRTSYQTTTQEEEIVLCSGGDLCPTVNGGATYALGVYPNLGGVPYGEGNTPAGLPANRESYGYKPGHIYLLAIEYRLPLDANTKDNGTAVLLMAGVDKHGQNRYSTLHQFKDEGRDEDRLVPTGDSYTWASYVFRVPSHEEVALRLPENAVPNPVLYVQIHSSGKLGEVPVYNERGVQVGTETHNSAIGIRDLQLFDLGETLAYPRVENADAPDDTTGVASCGGFTGETTSCTMSLTHWGRAYPTTLLDSTYSACTDPTDPHCAPCLGAQCQVCPGATSSCSVRRTSDARLFMPTATRADNTPAPGGFYLSALVPGLWPQAEYSSGAPKAAPYPIEILAGQALDSPDYWYDADFDENGNLYRGYLGVQLQTLHGLVRQYRSFFDPRFVDNTNAYTEARGFNRSQGLDRNPQTNLERYSTLHCRLLRELDRMGYDRSVPALSYTAGQAAMQTLSKSACDTNVRTSVIIYSDLFTPLHNGDKVYNTPYSGGSAWTPGSPDAFSLGAFSHNPVDPDVPNPTFAPWFNQDDPEMLSELFDYFEEQGFPMIYWMGSMVNTNAYYQGRSNAWDIASLVSPHSESVYGATTYYSDDFAADGDMGPAEQRAWEQESADCMWNPQWSLVRMFEMKPEDLRPKEGVLPKLMCDAYPNLTCINAFENRAADNGRYYGEPTRVGTPESIQLNRAKLPTLSFTLEDQDQRRPNSSPSATRHILIRGFARGWGGETRFRVSLVQPTGVLASSEILTLPDAAFAPVEQVLTLPRGDLSVSLMISHESGAPVILDGFGVYEELPHFGYDSQFRPRFPSDLDERASAQAPRYCQSFRVQP